ncbi:hypothetical protein CTI12_AA182100 [Artemisia annua]|uniref:CASP-like protein n=1 Tax=Artemisia annua TaxID=35608 RepID=A0A2U1MS47_ARTAN|nr:hypothetical protein CTI12_AA182100 [Artemisia annua]
MFICFCFYCSHVVVFWFCYLYFLLVTAILALAASSSSAGVMILLVRDSDLCKLDPKISCNTFQISIALAFMSWFLLAISSHTVLWLLASLS